MNHLQLILASPLGLRLFVQNSLQGCSAGATKNRRHLACLMQALDSTVYTLPFRLFKLASHVSKT